MTGLHALGGGEVFQLLRVTANILNKKLHTADKGWLSSFEIGRGTNNSSM